jgi:hypothetical protein
MSFSQQGDNNTTQSESPTIVAQEPTPDHLECFPFNIETPWGEAFTTLSRPLG